MKKIILILLLLLSTGVYAQRRINYITVIEKIRDCGDGNTYERHKHNLMVSFCKTSKSYRCVRWDGGSIPLEDAIALWEKEKYPYKIHYVNEKKLVRD